MAGTQTMVFIWWHTQLVFTLNFFFYLCSPNFSFLGLLSNGRPTQMTPVCISNLYNPQLSFRQHNKIKLKWDQTSSFLLTQATCVQGKCQMRACTSMLCCCCALVHLPILQTDQDLSGWFWYKCTESAAWSAFPGTSSTSWRCYQLIFCLMIPSASPLHLRKPTCYWSHCNTLVKLPKYFARSQYKDSV